MFSYIRHNTFFIIFFTVTLATLYYNDTLCNYVICMYSYRIYMTRNLVAAVRLNDINTLTDRYINYYLTT
jgi:hypothetical protein